MWDEEAAWSIKSLKTYILLCVIVACRLKLCTKGFQNIQQEVFLGKEKVKNYYVSKKLLQ